MSVLVGVEVIVRGLGIGRLFSRGWCISYVSWLELVSESRYCLFRVSLLFIEVTKWSECIIECISFTTLRS